MSDQSIVTLRKYFRGLLAGVAWLMLICVIIQVLLAGIALFVQIGKWDYHESFIHYFTLVPLLMLFLSLLAKVPKGIKWHCLGLFLMIMLQYITVSLSDAAPYLTALHPVLALVLFWESLVIAQGATKLLKSPVNKR
ncbi:putative membrane protein [Pullulanibacillus pueri]|uniref:Uncharacterized protein n=1 Tax=Pullulanibacillus pueri TaxID=1437324 RepID=A0A8J3ELM5_9BACL|nr:DUF6220 domain-containing protein [Pullulanibacillus pueri]MBM7681565.1 putative membrane protein [Pullulanibacillus pueri]GGH79646.1 hypothetical protein GCM10007096_14880 [Pullulanibacillus pueri]